MKQRIKEVIVVEGSHDSERLKRWFDCDTIITHGLSLRPETMEAIARAQARTGVIVFTDPDGPGAVIRRKIEEAVPGVRHAFVMKEEARTARKVGVEHADYEVLNEALCHTVTFVEPEQETISAAEFYELGLSGAENSEEKRRLIAKKLHIGYANAKTMRQRLNRLGISAEDVKGILENG